MAEIPGALVKMNDLEVAQNAAHSEALMTKIGANLNALIDALMPVGTIIPFHGGYHTNGSNAGYNMVYAAANTVTALNTALPDNWYVCNGAELNDAASPIFNGSGRFLPNLTDSRFLMGSTTAGGIGGSNSSAHVHGTDSQLGNIDMTHSHAAGALQAMIDPTDETGDNPVFYSTGSSPAWDSTYYVNGAQEGQGPFTSSRTQAIGVLGTTASTTPTVYNAAHSHTTNSQDNTENRPVYLACFFIYRVK